MLTTLMCRRCGQAFKSKRPDLAMYCPPCRKQNARDAAMRHEERTKHPCADCGRAVWRKVNRCGPCDRKWRKRFYRGSNNPFWKGGKTIDDGYVLVRIESGSHKGGAQQYKREHHIVWERTHGKPLPKGWVVHHFNGVKDDNRPENLLGMSRRDHHTQHRAYEARIRQLEEEVRALQQLRLPTGKQVGTEPCDYPYCETPCERPCDRSAPELQDN